MSKVKSKSKFNGTPWGGVSVEYLLHKKLRRGLRKKFLISKRTGISKATVEKWKNNWELIRKVG